MLRLIITTTRMEDGKEVDEDWDHAFEVMDTLEDYASLVLLGQIIAFTATVGKPEEQGQ